MHPAPSIIAFTTLSGLGFGLMAWLGIGAGGFGRLDALLLCGLAAGLAGAGLLASMLHLGQPRRFLKAFSQWRSSWLSREAVLAMASFAAFGVFGAVWVLLGVRSPWLGGLAAAFAVATVGATAMIYTQLRSVPRWHSPLTPVVFLLAALAGGALLSGAFGPAPWLLGGLGVVQVAAWVVGDRRRGGSTVASATGLGGLGRVRLLAPPHTGTNYLLREMVYVVGRRHALKLRVIGILLAVVLPMLVAVLASGPVAVGVAVLLHLPGVLVLRWLFFAEAEHVVGLYYGRG